MTRPGAPFSREPFGDGQPEALRAAGDDRDGGPVLQKHVSLMLAHLAVGFRWLGRAPLRLVAQGAPFQNIAQALISISRRP